jgi:glycosyltransferase involved in cell wall biosynthesis
MGNTNRKSMKILWVSLVKFPPLCSYLGEEATAHCGWLYSSAKALLDEMPEVQLGVIVQSFGQSFEEYEVDGITYFLIPTKSISNTDNRQISGCRKALERFMPTLIHIHGTEYSLAKAVCLANRGGVKILANIQGLAGPYMRYADGGLSLWDKWTNITPLDFYRGTLLLNAKRNFRHRAECEHYVLTHTTDVVGRTRWDHDHVMTINPKLRYHFMNETLRDSFYKAPVWNFERCKKHTIFVSNSGSPLKGAHQVLKALPIILRQYPDTIVNFCGRRVMSGEMKDILRFQGYHLYLRRLVKKLHLQNNVRFLGSLPEEQMKQQFLDANVYVMPSSIENSPNSLCEAQILGTPLVSSYCGGTSTLLTDGETGYFYRYEEYEMLAQIVIRLFGRKDFETLSTKERKSAFARHDRKKNAIELVKIYRHIQIV